MFDSLFGGAGARSGRDARRQIRNLEKDLRKAGRAGNDLRVAEVHEEIAFAKISCQDYRGAIESLFKVIQVHNQTGERKSAARAYSNIGVVYREMGDLQNAEENVKKARLIDEQIGDGLGLMFDGMNRGILELERGQCVQAAASFEEAYQRAEELREPRWSAWLLKMYGDAQLRSYNFQVAVDALNAFLDRATELGDPYPAVEGARLLARTYLLAGMYLSCHLCLEDALVAAKRSGNPALEGAVLADQGFFHIVVGDYRKGRSLSEDARILLDDSTPPIYRLLVDRNMGMIFAHQGRALDGARKNFRAGLGRAQELRSWRLEGEFQLLLAQVEYLGGKIEEAENAAHEALRLAELTQDQALMGNSRIMMGRLYQKQGQPEQSHRARSEAVEIADALPLPEFRWRAHHALARSYFAQSRYAEARKHFETAVEIMRSAQDFLGMDYLAEAYFGARHRAEVLRDMVQLLIRMGLRAEARGVHDSIANKEVRSSLAHLFED